MTPSIQLLVHCITLLATVAGIVQAVLIRLRVKEIIESSLLLFIRFGTIPSRWPSDDCTNSGCSPQSQRALHSATSATWLRTLPGFFLKAPGGPLPACCCNSRQHLAPPIETARMTPAVPDGVARPRGATLTPHPFPHTSFPSPVSIVLCLLLSSGFVLTFYFRSLLNESCQHSRQHLMHISHFLRRS